jgi:uncharacterized membrane protein (DUF106 family)
VITSYFIGVTVVLAIGAWLLYMMATQRRRDAGMWDVVCVVIASLVCAALWPILLPGALVGLVATLASSP